MVPLPFKLPFQEGPGRRQAKIYKKKKEKNVSKRFLCRNRHPSLQITFSKSPGRNLQDKIYKKKEKNVSNRSLTIMASPPLNYLSKKVQDEVSAEIYKK